MKLFFMSICLFLSSTLHADNGFPRGCKPLTLKDTAIVVSGAKFPVLVLLHNQSAEDIWVTHPVDDPGASAGWTTKLQGGNWSALNLQNESFEINCVESKPGHEQQIPCNGILSLCLWEGIKIPAGNGTFWAGEDLSLSALESHLNGRGYGLPKSP